MFSHDVIVSAGDGYSLAATIFKPVGSPRSTVLINSATAVPRRIYQAFAIYLAERGFVTLTYDYRGVGESRPRSLRGFEATMRDWAEFDVAGAINYMRGTWPVVPLAVVGHSFGGQAVGLAPNNIEISHALLIAANAGYWRLMTVPERYRIYALVRFILPPIVQAMGYVPSARLGLAEDIPKGVFANWADWVRKPRYFFDDVTLKALINFPNYTGKMRAIGFTDDPWATAPAIDLLLSGFTGTQPERRQINPRDIGVNSIGHFGFFRPEHRDTLWRDAADWIEGQV
jgi:predicted alpha/beta hydrolase